MSYKRRKLRKGNFKKRGFKKGGFKRSNRKKRGQYVKVTRGGQRL